ncbi:putative DNA-binding protein [Gammaproteobacteria bacterium]
MSLLGSIIKAKRLEIGLTGPELSRLSGIYPAVIYNLENDLKVPEKNRWLLVDVLKVPFDGRLFSKKIREKRKALEWSIAALSKVSKVSTSVIYLLENNKKTPSLLLCYKLAKILKLNLENFVGTAS